MMILDSYKALEVLGKDNRIDIDNVAITGWSLGGGVALFSAWEPLIASIGIKERFKAHLAFYPPCLVEMDLIEFSKVPIHILIGEKDDWVTASACEDLVRDLSDNNVDIGIDFFLKKDNTYLSLSSNPSDVIFKLPKLSSLCTSTPAS